MSLEIIILIYAVSLAILVVEAFVPSGGVLAIVGGIGLGVSLYYGFTLPKYGILIGTGQSLVAIIVIPSVIYMGFKKMTLKSKLQSEDGFTSEKTGMHLLLDKHGITHTNLRPSGTAVINGKKIDVVTEGDMIDKDAPIKVIKVDGNRVVVRKV